MNDAKKANGNDAPRITLKREILRELSDLELDRVNGGVSECWQCGGSGQSFDACVQQVNNGGANGGGGWGGNDGGGGWGGNDGGGGWGGNDGGGGWGGNDGGGGWGGNDGGYDT